MNIDFLKPILGDELFQQVSEKLSAASGIDLRNVADGSYIPKEKLDEKINALKDQAQQMTALQGQLTEAQKQAGTVEGLNQQITKLTGDLSARDATIQGMAMKYDVKDALRGMNARNADVILPLLNMDKIKRGEDGKLTGLQEQVAALKKSDAYLFDAQPGSRGGFNGGQDTGGGDNSPNAAMNAAIRSMSGRA